MTTEDEGPVEIDWIDAQSIEDLEEQLADAWMDATYPSEWEDADPDAELDLHRERKEDRD